MHAVVVILRLKLLVCNVLREVSEDKIICVVAKMIASMVCDYLTGLVLLPPLKKRTKNDARGSTRVDIYREIEFEPTTYCWQSPAIPLRHAIAGRYIGQYIGR